MLDWFTGFLGFDGSKLPLNRRLEVSPSGEILVEKDAWKSIRSSWNSNIQINRATPTHGMISSKPGSPFSCLAVSGNPVKFLQGHNVYGPSVKELDVILKRLVESLSGRVCIPDSDRDDFSVHHGYFDTNIMVDLGNDQAVHDWITSALLLTRTRTNLAAPPNAFQKNLTGATTVYWNRGSRRWDMKAYCKLCELMKHKPDDKALFSELAELAHGMLRIELRLRRKEILDIDDIDNLDNDIFWNYYNRIEISDMKAKANKRLSVTALSLAAQRSYMHWEVGDDLPALVAAGKMTKSTYYRHRKEIKEKLSIDVAVPNRKELEESESVDTDMFGEKFLKERQRPDVPLCMQPDKVAAFFRSLEPDLFKKD